jgi:hypothetical protein
MGSSLPEKRSGRQIARGLVIVLAFASFRCTTVTSIFSSATFDGKVSYNLEFNPLNADAWYALRERFPGTVEVSGTNEVCQIREI